MHGLINRSIERFVHDTCGQDTWIEIMQKLDLGYAEFEPMWTYDNDLTFELLDQLSNATGRPVPDILEDIGIYLVTNPGFESFRRLLRFGGVGFVDFLHSLDDLPDRARLVVADLSLPTLHLREINLELFSLTVQSGNAQMPGFGHVVVGLLRAMADDYGALVMLGVTSGHGKCEVIEIRVLDVEYATGRDFLLGAQPA